jgi:hypothetical protein
MEDVRNPLVYYCLTLSAAIIGVGGPFNGSNAIGILYLNFPRLLQNELDAVVDILLHLGTDHSGEED